MDDIQNPGEDDARPTTALVQDALPEGMKEIQVRVGPAGHRVQRFIGKELGESQRFNPEGAEVVRVYQSRKGKLVIHRHIVEWADFTASTKQAYQEKKDEFLIARRASTSSDFSVFTHWAKGFKDWREMFGLGEDGSGDFTLEIVDSLDELRDRIPAKVYRIVADAVENPSTQFLDI
ncbi:EXLDI protein [Nocardia sp. NPDC088792]|uniref:EXLDI protein n=1 Tax=Nocardia sp. NPDC088792 TaxID=3364332 RepID=UPI003802078A